MVALASTTYATAALEQKFKLALTSCGWFRKIYLLWINDLL